VSDWLQRVSSERSSFSWSQNSSTEKVGKVTHKKPVGEYVAPFVQKGAVKKFPNRDRKSSLRRRLRIMRPAIQEDVIANSNNSIRPFAAEGKQQEAGFIN
jgi:hypothetical protein